jgi:hypothetical protein
MVAALRDTYVVGPLMVLALIPAATLAGASLALGDFELAGKAATRGLLDIACVLLLVALIFFWKQRTKRRRPSCRDQRASGALDTACMSIS